MSIRRGPSLPAHELPRRLGPFLLVERLGKGAMGEVYRARREGSPRELALKLVRPKLLLDAQALARFQREGQITAALRHPGIVPIHDAGEVEGRPYLAYALIEPARTLREAAVTWSPRERVEAVRDAARALGFAHARGVVHRDVKPDNLLVDGEGRVLVADFGLATAQGLDRLTRSSAMVGTPLYASPEQLTQGTRGTAPDNDVWSLGVVLYELLTGEHPFPVASVVELVGRQQAGLEPAHRRNPAVPREFSAVCARALRPSRAERYPDADALADAIDEALQEGAPRRVPWSVPAIALALLLPAAVWWETGQRVRDEPVPPASPTRAASPETSPAPAVAVPPSPGAATRSARRLEAARAHALLRNGLLLLDPLLESLGRLAEFPPLRPLPADEQALVAELLQLFESARGERLAPRRRVVLLEALAAAGLAAPADLGGAALDGLWWAWRVSKTLDDAHYLRAVLAAVQLDVELQQEHFVHFDLERLRRGPQGVPARFVEACWLARRGRGTAAMGALLDGPDGAELGPVTRASGTTYRYLSAGSAEAARAVSALRAALVASPQSLRVHLALARNLATLGQGEEAVALTERMLALYEELGAADRSTLGRSRFAYCEEAFQLRLRCGALAAAEEALAAMAAERSDARHEGIVRRARASLAERRAALSSSGGTGSGE